MKTRPGFFYLADCPEENKFFLRNGRTVQNMEELAMEFNSMDHETFTHHVNAEKNDFHAWIKDTIKDESLAENIQLLKDKNEMHAEILKRIDNLKTYNRGEKTMAKKKKKKK
ncbi:MAG: hypothetical protein V1743_06275 [Nanoarchaeota archaeon]